MDRLRSIEVQVEAAAVMGDQAQQRAVVTRGQVERVDALGGHGLGHCRFGRALLAHFARPGEVGAPVEGFLCHPSVLSGVPRHPCTRGAIRQGNEVAHG